MNGDSQIQSSSQDADQVDRTDIAAPALDELQSVRHRYLELMQSCLTGDIYRDVSSAPFGSNTYDAHAREHGMDWPSRAQTMVGVKRLANLRTLTEAVITDGVPGDMIETGVWRGGACILMRAVLYAHNVSDRCVWVADSFEGLPKANELQYPADVGYDFHNFVELSVALDEVQENFKSYGLLDGQVKFLKGWFKDTLPTAPIENLALMRLDGDMYESTMDALVSLYPKLSPRGYVVIDDYHVVPPCKTAVHDYCEAHDIQPEIIEIDGVGVYWQKLPTHERSDPIGPISHAVKSSEEQVARLNQALNNLNQVVFLQLNQSLAERDSQIESLGQAVAERDSQIESLGQAVVECDGQIAEPRSSTNRLFTKLIRTIGVFFRNLRISRRSHGSD